MDILLKNSKQAMHKITKDHLVIAFLMICGGSYIFLIIDENKSEAYKTSRISSRMISQVVPKTTWSIACNSCSNRSSALKSSSSTTKLSFIKSLNSFPWLDYEQSIRNNNRQEFLRYSSQFLTTLLPFLTMPPSVKLNSSCTRPAFKFPSYVPKCNPLFKPRKVGVLLQFGFESDILEIHLRELEDVVDYFFILESTRSHFMGIEKPLLWEVLKYQERFHRFLNKTVHFILDDGETLSAFMTNSKRGLDKGYGFEVENKQEMLRWWKFMEWNRITGYFEEDDILGFGDADEIPSRDVIFYLKHCEMPSDPVDIGIWMPMGRINQVYRSDWPVPGHPFSIGDPTYWTMKRAMKNTSFLSYPSRRRGKSQGYLLGGMHMTRYGYLPVQIVEYFTASEAYAKKVLELISSLNNLTMEKVRELELEMGEVPKYLKLRLVHLSTSLFKKILPEEFNQLVYLPWFYNCNRRRYPVWEGDHDTRLD